MSYVYHLSEGVYKVGHYDPDDKWVNDSDHKLAGDAAVRCGYLNGRLNENGATVAMSLRDLFAAAAMAGMLSRVCRDGYNVTANVAYEYADAMMDRRKK